MTEQEAIKILQRDYNENIHEEGYKEEFADVLEAEAVAILSLEKQIKLAEWIENYKQRGFFEVDQSLHPNQRWNVTFFNDDDTSVGLEYKCVSLIVHKDLFNERFELCS